MADHTFRAISKRYAVTRVLSLEWGNFLRSVEPTLEIIDPSQSKGEAETDGQYLKNRKYGNGETLRQLRLVRQRRPATKPARLAAPMIKVKTTSVGVKCPDTIFAQPRRKSQMKVISTSQMAKQGEFPASVRDVK